MSRARAVCALAAAVLAVLPVVLNGCDDLHPGDDIRDFSDPIEAGRRRPAFFNPGHLQLHVQRSQLPVCRRPYGLALSPDQRTIYVACAGDGRVTAFETEFLNRLWTSPALNERIYRLTVDPRRDRLYAIGMNGRYLHALDTRTGEPLARLNLGFGLADLSLTPGADWLLVSTMQPPRVAVIDLVEPAVAGHIELSTPPGDLAVASDGQIAAAASGVWRMKDREGEPVKESVYLFEPWPDGRVVAELGLGGGQSRKPLFLDRNKRLLAPDRSGASVWLFDLSRRRLMREWAVGRAPEKVLVDQRGRLAYSLDTQGAGLTRIDLRRLRANGHLSLAADPQDFLLSGDGTHLYVALAGRPGRVAVVETTTFTVADEIRVGDDPCAMIAAKGGRQVFVSNFLSNTISVLE